MAAGSSNNRAAWCARMQDASCIDHGNVWGANSGLQRKQGRNPAFSACAAWPKKRQFANLGHFTRHTGRQ
jgi:hypothetical protein